MIKQLVLIVCLACAFNSYSQELNKSEILTNKAIIQLVKSKVPPNIIINRIQNLKSDFNVSTDSLIELTNNGVSEDVIKAIIRADEAAAQKSSTTDDRETLTKNYFTQKVMDESKGIIQVTTFKKIDGYEQEHEGIKMYVIEWEAEILITQEIWFRNSFEGEDAAFYVQTTQPKQGYWDEFMSGKPGHCSAGVKLLLSGDSRIQRTEKTSRVDKLNIKKSALIAAARSDNSVTGNNNSNSISANSISDIVSNTPLFTGYVSLEGNTYALELYPPTIHDEMYQDIKLKNLTYNAFTKSGRFSEKRNVTINDSPIVYTLKGTYYTDYIPTQTSTGAINYFASVNYTLELFNKTNNKSVKTYSGSVTNSNDVISISYASKEAALKDVAESKLSQVILKLIYSNFPVKAEITQIVDTNKKGKLKLVKISAGSNIGVHKGFNFNIENQQEKDKYSIVVTEVFDNYSICEVKSNNEFIKSKLLSGSKVNVCTIW